MPRQWVTALLEGRPVGTDDTPFLIPFLASNGAPLAPSCELCPSVAERIVAFYVMTLADPAMAYVCPHHADGLEAAAADRGPALAFDAPRGEPPTSTNSFPLAGRVAVAIVDHECRIELTPALDPCRNPVVMNFVAVAAHAGRNILAVKSFGYCEEHKEPWRIEG